MQCRWHTRAMLGLEEISNEKTIWRYEIAARGGTDKIMNLTAVAGVKIVDGFVQRPVRFMRGCQKGRSPSGKFNGLLTPLSPQ